MVDFSEPPERGEPLTNGLDTDARTTLALARLGDRARALEVSVANLQGEVRHLPTKTTATALVMGLIAVIGIIAIAYWNGVTGKFDAVNAKIDAVNSRIDSVSRSIDKLSPAIPVQPAPVPTQRSR